MDKEKINNFKLISLINPEYIYIRIKEIKSWGELSKRFNDLIVLVLKITTFRYGAGYWEKKRQEKLTNYLDEIAKIDEIGVHCGMGEYYFGRKDYEKALKVYCRMLELVKDDKQYKSTIHSKIAQIYLKKGKPDLVIQEINKALEHDKYNEYAYSILGDVFMQKNEYEKALTEYKKALELIKWDKKVKSALCSKIAQVYAELGKYDFSLEMINKALEYDKYNGFAYTISGRIHKFKKEYEKALKEMDRSLELSKGNKEKSSEICIEKARVYAERKEYDLAISTLKKALELDPQNLKSRLFLAKIYVMHIRYEEALQEYNKIIGLKTGDGNLEKELYQYRAQIYSQLGQYARMAEEINRLIGMGFSNSSNYLTLSAAFKMQGLDEKAEKAFDKAMAMIREEEGVKIEAKEVSPKKSKKEENRVLNEKEIARGETKLKSKVRSLNITLTSRCNLNCKMCFVEKIINPEMSRKVKEEIINTFPYLEEIMWLGGEVFLDADFNRMMEEAIKYGIKQNITTNGLLLNEGTVRKLISSGIELVLSIDGTTKEVYESIRRGAKYEGILEKLNMINRVRKGINPGYRMTLNTVIMKSNYQQIENFPEFAKEHDFNNLNYLMVSENRNNENIFAFNRDEEVLSYIDRALDKARERCKKYAINFNNNITKEMLGSSGMQNNTKSQDESPSKPETIKGKSYRENKKVICAAPWKALNIDSQGNVVPSICCFCKHVLGNLNEAGMEEIWNGDKMVDYRRKITSGDLAKVCTLKDFYKGIPYELLR